MTYKQIQEDYQRLYHKSRKTCWIADVKRELGLTKRFAINRIDLKSAKYPYPNNEIKDRIRRIILQGSL